MTLQTSKKIAILAGEASGDLHGGELIKTLQRLHPTWQFMGIGGKNMQEAGVNTIVDASELSTMGAIEIISRLGAIVGAFTKMVRLLKTEKPDLLILIDFPEFNLRIAKKAKKLGIKILYYISPQIWAWRKGRVKIIKKFVDHMAVVFPFEVDFYKKSNVPVTFVGHPLIDVVHPFLSKEQAFDYFEIDKTKNPVIGLLPGSRHSEIERLLPIILTTAENLQKKYSNANFILPLASTLKLSEIQFYLKKFPNLKIHVTQSRTYDALQLCDVAIAASGTIMLELALLKIPSIAIYRLTPLSYFIGKLLIDVPFITLCNHIAYKKIIPELIQNDANPQRITFEVCKILENPDYKNKMQQELGEVKAILGLAGANQKLAELIDSMI